MIKCGECSHARTHTYPPPPTDTQNERQRLRIEKPLGQEDNIEKGDNPYDDSSSLIWLPRESTLFKQIKIAKTIWLALTGNWTPRVMYPVKEKHFPGVVQWGRVRKWAFLVSLPFQIVTVVVLSWVFTVFILSNLLMSYPNIVVHS